MEERRRGETIFFHTQRGKWAVYVPSAVGANLQFYPCPAGYCRCSHDTSFGNSTCGYIYKHSDADFQCTCGRKGDLDHRFKCRCGCIHVLLHCKNVFVV